MFFSLPCPKSVPFTISLPAVNHGNSLFSLLHLPHIQSYWLFHRSDTFYQLCYYHRSQPPSFLAKMKATVFSLGFLLSSCLTQSKSHSPHNDIQGLTQFGPTPLPLWCPFSPPCSLHSSLASPEPQPAGFHHIDMALAIPFASNGFPLDIYMANSLTSLKSLLNEAHPLIYTKSILNSLPTIIQ